MMTEEVEKREKWWGESRRGERRQEGVNRDECGQERQAKSSHRLVQAKICPVKTSKIGRPTWNSGEDGPAPGLFVVGEMKSELVVEESEQSSTRDDLRVTVVNRRSGV